MNIICMASKTQDRRDEITELGMEDFEYHRSEDKEYILKMVNQF